MEPNEKQFYMKKYSGNKPLDIAIMNGDLELFQQLIKQGAIFTDSGYKSDSKLNFILTNADYDIGLELIKLGYAYYDVGILRFIWRAIQKGSYEDISYILEKIPNIKSIPIFEIEGQTIIKLTHEQLNILFSVIPWQPKFSQVKQDLLLWLVFYYDTESLSLLLKHTSLDDKEKWKFLEVLIRKNLPCEKLRNVIELFQMPIEKTMNILQGYQPGPICEGYPVYASKRGKVSSQTLSALGFIPPIIEPKYKILSNFRIDDECFCLSVEPGIYEDVYLPVIRYGKSARSGFYGKSEYNPSEVQFTWYYLEPESGIYLHCPRLLVAKNKVAVSVYLANHYGSEALQLEIFQLIKDELSFDRILPNMTWEQFSNLILAQEKIDITEKFDNYFNSKIPNVEIFVPGTFDFLDKFITHFPREHNIQVIALTHEKGYGRMVSECVDNRFREESFKSLYQIVQ